MNDKQITIYSMFTVVDAVFDVNAAKVATVPALVAAHTNLKARINAISNTSEQQKTITTGVTPDKNATRDSLRTTTLINAGLLNAYAVSINDIILQSISKVTLSELIRMKDDEIGERAQTIHDKANANIAALAPFGITPAILTSYQTLINNYNTKAPAPRAAASQKVALTTEVKTLLIETRAYLKKTVDSLMLNFKTTDVEFYNTYKAAREIIDHGSIPTQAAGSIANQSSGDPIAGVQITATKDGIKNYLAASLPDGSFTIMIPVPGNYTITFTKAGYQTHQSTNTLITLGQTTTLKIELTPTP